MSENKFDNARICTMVELDFRLRNARDNSLEKCRNQIVTLTVTVKNGGICDVEATTIEKHIDVDNNKSLI